MDPAPKLSISNVGTQYQFSNAYLLFKDQRSGYQGWVNRIKYKYNMHLEIQAKPSTFLKE